MLFALLFKKLKLPELLGMILAGIILGPLLSMVSDFPFNLFSKQIQQLSGELRTAALLVILIRAGLGIKKKSLNQIGVRALYMSILPCLLEGATIFLIAHYYLLWSIPISGLLAFVVAAVSPAVIVPEMLRLKEQGLGAKKNVPTLLLAGASVDNVFAITMFGMFLGLAGGESINCFQMIYTVPLSILLGIIMGLFLGYLLFLLFKKYQMRDTKKILIFMITAILFHGAANSASVKAVIPIASLIGIMAIGFVILEKNNLLANRLAIKFNKIWVIAEIILFVLIGAQVDIKSALSLEILYLAFIIVSAGLLARIGAVFIALTRSELNKKERIFCAITYLPKATVQAAVGAIPLSMGIEHGNAILSIAVISIIITAPLGAIAINFFAPRLLEVN